MDPKTLFGVARRHAWFMVPLGLAGLNALLWTVFATLGGSPDLPGDSSEAYVWGREFQLGYYKHPPFWAWIAGAWFSAFPHRDWAFYLLSELNASLGPLGAWALLGRFTKGPERLAGTLLLLLTTFYTFNALRFNANTIQLSLWPWTMYFLVRSIEKKTVMSGAALGLIAGAAILSKYYTALLLLSCFLAALVHRDRRQYFESPAPWVALLMLAGVIAPHLVWVIQHNDQPIVYAASQTTHPKSAVTLFGFLLMCALYHVPQLGVILAVKLKQKMRGEFTPAFHIQHGLAFLSVLALTPVALTSLVGLASYRVTSPFVMPIFSLTPFLLLFLLGADARRVARSSAWVYGLLAGICLIAAPFLPGIIKPGDEPVQPKRQVSRVALDEWKKTIQAPLHLVSGTEPYSRALTFYAPGDVSEFTEFNLNYAPWVTPQRIKQQGLLVICLAKDHQCLEQASPYETTGTRVMQTTVVPKWGAFLGPTLPFTIITIPPGK
ncbi:MAG: glycosyltransferase family 39 protein [Thiobacillaceae bacterium]